MSYVKVTFKLDVSDEDDNTGLSEDDHEAVHEVVAETGGYDVEIEKVD